MIILKIKDFTLKEKSELKEYLNEKFGIRVNIYSLEVEK